MSRGDLRLKVVRGKIAYDPPGSEPNAGAGTIYGVGEIFEFPEGPDISRFGNMVVVYGEEAESPAEVPPTEEAPAEEASQEEDDSFEGAVEAVKYSRGFMELCKLAEDEGIKNPKKLRSKQKVAEAIVKSRRG